MFKATIDLLVEVEIYICCDPTRQNVIWVPPRERIYASAVHWGKYMAWGPMGENPSPFGENLCSHYCLQVCLKQPWGTAAVAQHRGISALTVVLPTERRQLCSSESLLRSLWFWREVPAGLGCKEACLCLSFGLSIGSSCCKQGVAWNGFRGWGWSWRLQSTADVGLQWAWNSSSSAAVVWRLQIQTRRWNKTSVSALLLGCFALLLVAVVPCGLCAGRASQCCCQWPQKGMVGGTALHAAGLRSGTLGMKLSALNHCLSEQPQNSGIGNRSPFVLSYTHSNDLSTRHFLSINDQLGLMALACAFSHQLLPTGH